MSKQDRVYTRTASDLERKYNFGKRFAEILGIATDAQDTAKSALDAVSNLDNNLTQEEIFNILTNNGESQAIYREDGLIYINASFIKTGYISSDMIKAGVIRSLDYEVIEVDPIYPSDTLYPGAEVYPNNGEDMVRGLEIDFRAGVIRGFTGSQDNAEVNFRLAKAEFSLAEMDSRLDKVEGSAATIKKLWENASPTSSFVAQAIVLDLSGYDYVEIWCHLATNASYVFHSIAPIGKVTRVFFPEGLLYVRDFIVHADHIYCGGGAYFPTYGNATTSPADHAVIPIAIYGVKGVS